MTHLALSAPAQHADDNAMDEPDEIARFYDRGSGLMRAGRRPYRFHDTRQSASGRWEMWMEAHRARALRAAQADEAPARRATGA